MMMPLPRIYPITDKALARKSTHLSILKDLVRGGATLVQIRDKTTPERALLRDLLLCVEFAEKHGVRVIVNDRCDLMLSCGAAGVHLGQEDLPPEAARKLVGRKKLIGYSTHSSKQVTLARKLPVDYIGFGPVYPTSTKQSSSPTVGVEGLRRACAASTHPVVAIGGIGLDQIPDIFRAGAASAAVISALMCAPSLARRMEEFLRKATGRV